MVKLIVSRKKVILETKSNLKINIIFTLVIHLTISV